MRIHNSLFLTLITIASISFLLAGCTKDKYTTKPQLKFKSVKDYNVEQGDLIEITLEFTDKEGDISDSLFIQSITTNTNCTGGNRSLKYIVPSFPTSAKQEGEFQIVYIYGEIKDGYATWPGSGCGQPDTTTFRFWLKDKAQNVSDTVQTDKPIIIQN